MKDEPKFEVWRRTDGMTEIEGEGLMARFRTDEEVDAYLAGLRGGLSVARRWSIQTWNVEDRRPPKPAPRRPNIA